MPHPFHDVAIAGVHNTRQARRLPGHDSGTISLEAALGALADAGMDPGQVDGVVGEHANALVVGLGLGACTRRPGSLGIPTLLDAAGLVASGECTTVVVAAGGAGLYTDRAQTAPWTRPANELVVGYGLFTAAEFALVARRHMLRYGTTTEQLAAAAAVVRTNGHDNPAAVYHGRGPFTPADILASRMIAEPFHLLECAMTSEGGCALVLTTAERAAHGGATPVHLLGGASDSLGPSYVMAPSYDLGADLGQGVTAGMIGRRAARHAFATAGLTPDDVDVCELYDPFSFELIRQLEAFGFCDEGEGGAFVEDGHIAAGGQLPVTTDGGTMSFSHPGINAQQLQRVIRGVEQLRGTATTHQVDRAAVALCSNGGSGALFTDVLLLGSERP